VGYPGSREFFHVSRVPDPPAQCNSIRDPGRIHAAFRSRLPLPIAKFRVLRPLLILRHSAHRFGARLAANRPKVTNLKLPGDDI